MDDGLRLALTTLTVAPVRGPTSLDRRTAGHAMALAPLVGLGLSLMAATVMYGMRITQAHRGSELLPAALALGALALLTRGLHLDGLVDLTDGLASYRGPQQARNIMKAPGVGALGVAAVILVLLVQAAALGACVHSGRGTASLLLAVVTGRLAITAACVSTPAAATEGLGALVAGTVRRGVTSVWAVSVAAAFAGYAVFDLDTTSSDPVRVLRTVAAVALALAAARGLRHHAVRRLGGLTGDVLGALSEVATTVCLVVLSMG